MVEENVSQETKEEEVKPKEEKTSESKSEGETTPVIEAAREANRVKAELLEREEKLQKRKEKLHAEQMLGGGSPAGGPAPKEPEISDKEYAEKAMAGELNVKKE